MFFSIVYRSKKMIKYFLTHIEANLIIKKDCLIYEIKNNLKIQEKTRANKTKQDDSRINQDKQEKNHQKLKY